MEAETPALAGVFLSCASLTISDLKCSSHGFLNVFKTRRKYAEKLPQHQINPIAATEKFI